MKYGRIIVWLYIIFSLLAVVQMFGCETDEWQEREPSAPLKSTTGVDNIISNYPYSR